MSSPSDSWPPPASHAHVVPRLAATVALVRRSRDGGRPEVLLTQRPATMAFAADVHVFPGGAVDPGDGDPALAERSTIDPEAAAARLGGDLDPATALAVHVAALRELAEEAGVFLVAPAPDATASAEAQAALHDGSPFADALRILDAAAGTPVRLGAGALRPLARWVTPPLLPRRFDARFFVATLPDGVEPSFAADEVVAHRWTPPAAALEAAASGELMLWLPTSMALEQLDDLARRPDRQPAAMGPWRPPEVVEASEDVVRLRVHGAGGIPGRDGIVTLVGRREVVLVDMGDPMPEAAEAILEIIAARGGRLVAILLTDAHPDVAAGAESVAMRVGVRIYAPAGMARRLPHEVLELPPGSRLPVGDRDVRVPGPGLAPASCARAARRGGCAG